MLIKAALFRYLWIKCNGVSNYFIYYVLRNYMLYIAPKSFWPPVLIVSPGGVGTTMLIKHVRKFKIVNSFDDSDGLKHLGRIYSKNGPQKVVFISGGVKESFDSLSRRGWLDVNYRKITGQLMPNDKEARFDAWSKAVKSQISYFHLYNLKNQCSVYFVDYDNIWNEIKEIQNFLDISSDEFASSLPARTPRTLQK